MASFSSVFTMRPSQLPRTGSMASWDALSSLKGMSHQAKFNLGDDEIWDRWMVEGPGMVWYFRGTPHVHTWVNIAGKQA